ncbi:MAG: MFS transporter [Chloroflexi bacterium]|nr:MFS transporter [Chloroflexota bacterium]MDA1174051.1 MFS transporter [Chloroflexota bacterium]
MRETTNHRANYKWIALGIAATSTVLGTSDFSIVLIALPTLTDVFSGKTSTVIWVSLGFQLISLGLVLPAGRFGDLFGVRRVFVGGMLVYAIGMLLAGLATGIVPLILARMVQSAGSAMSNALASAIVTSAFPRQERGKALGILMSAAAVGMMIGPSLGGLMLGTLGWRWIFLIRVPLAAGAFVLAVILLEKDHPRENKPEGRFDILGSITLFFAASTFAIGVNRGSSQGFESLPFIAFFGTSLLLIATFIIMSLRSPSPVIDLRIFKRRAFAIGSGLMVASTMTVVTLSFLMPFYLIIGKSLSPAGAGLVLLAGPAMMIFMSPIAGRLSDSFGPRILTPLGLGTTAVAFFGLSTLPADAPIPLILVMLGASSLGSSLFNPPNQSAIMGAAPPDQMGTVSGLIPTLRNIGLITGIATAEAIFVANSGWSGGSAQGADLGLAQRELVIHGIAVTLRVFGTIAGIAALVATMRGDDPNLRRH